MSFFYICSPSIAEEVNKAIPLKVIRDSGIEVNPDININVTDMISDKKDTIYKNFYNQGNGGITFSIQVILEKSQSQSNVYATTEYYPNDMKVLNWLDYYIRNMKPVYVVTDAIDIKNGTYIITDNSSRVQTFKDYTVWDLEFTTFTGLNTVKFNGVNNAIKKVIKKSKKKTTAKKKTKTSTTTKKSKLSKCKVSQLKYTGKKVTKVKCVSYLQEILYKKHGLLTKKQVDGWYGPKTMNAVKKYQKKYKKKYKLKVTGKVDKNTLKALCK